MTVGMIGRVGSVGQIGGASGVTPLLPLSTPIIVEGDSNTDRSSITYLPWFVTLYTYMGGRIWLPPNAYLATVGSSVAYSAASNSMVDRQATTEALLGSYSGKKIFIFSIGTNSEFGQAGDYASTAELQSYLEDLKAVDPGNVIVICVLPLYNEDLGNSDRIDNQETWARSSSVVDYVLDNKDISPSLGTMNVDNVHMDAAQHFAVGQNVYNLMDTLVSGGDAYSLYSSPFYEGTMANFTAKSGTGYTGDFPTNWIAQRLAGDGTMTGSETTVNGYPALQLSMTGGTTQSTFRVRRAITHSAPADTVLDAFATIDLVSSTALVPYLGLTAGNGHWPVGIVYALDVDPDDWDIPLIYRSYVDPLAAPVTSLNFDIRCVVDPGETTVVTISRPVLAETA